MVGSIKNRIAAFEGLAEQSKSSSKLLAIVPPQPGFSASIKIAKDVKGKETSGYVPPPPFKVKTNNTTNVKPSMNGKPSMNSKPSSVRSFQKSNVGSHPYRNSYGSNSNQYQSDLDAYGKYKGSKRESQSAQAQLSGIQQTAEQTVEQTAERTNEENDNVDVFRHSPPNTFGRESLGDDKLSKNQVGLDTNKIETTTKTPIEDSDEGLIAEFAVNSSDGSRSGDIIEHRDDKSVSPLSFQGFKIASRRDDGTSSGESYTPNVPVIEEESPGAISRPLSPSSSSDSTLEPHWSSASSSQYGYATNGFVNTTFQQPGIHPAQDIQPQAQSQMEKKSKRVQQENNSSGESNTRKKWDLPDITLDEMNDNDDRNYHDAENFMLHEEFQDTETFMRNTELEDSENLMLNEKMQDSGDFLPHEEEFQDAEEFMANYEYLKRQKAAVASGGGDTKSSEQGGDNISTEDIQLKELPNRSITTERDNTKPAIGLAENQNNFNQFDSLLEERKVNGDIIGDSLSLQEEYDNFTLGSGETGDFFMSKDNDANAYEDDFNEQEFRISNKSEGNYEKQAQLNGYQHRVTAEDPQQNNGKDQYHENELDEGHLQSRGPRNLDPLFLDGLEDRSVESKDDSFTDYVSNMQPIPSFDKQDANLSGDGGLGNTMQKTSLNEPKPQDGLITENGDGPNLGLEDLGKAQKASVDDIEGDKGLKKEITQNDLNLDMMPLKTPRNSSQPILEDHDSMPTSEQRGKSPYDLSLERSHSTSSPIYYPEEDFVEDDFEEGDYDDYGYGGMDPDEETADDETGDLLGIKFDELSMMSEANESNFVNGNFANQGHRFQDEFAVQDSFGISHLEGKAAGYDNPTHNFVNGTFANQGHHFQDEFAVQEDSFGISQLEGKAAEHDNPTQFSRNAYEDTQQKIDNMMRKANAKKTLSDFDPKFRDDSTAGSASYALTGRAQQPPYPNHKIGTMDPLFLDDSTAGDTPDPRQNNGLSMDRWNRQEPRPNQLVQNADPFFLENSTHGSAADSRRKDDRVKEKSQGQNQVGKEDPTFGNGSRGENGAQQYPSKPLMAIQENESQNMDYINMTEKTEEPFVAPHMRERPLEYNSSTGPEITIRNESNVSAVSQMTELTFENNKRNNGRTGTDHLDHGVQGTKSEHSSLMTYSLSESSNASIVQKTNANNNPIFRDRNSLRNNPKLKDTNSTISELTDPALGRRPSIAKRPSNEGRSSLSTISGLETIQPKIKQGRDDSERRKPSSQFGRSGRHGSIDGSGSGRGRQPTRKPHVVTSGKDGRKDKKKRGFSIRSLSPFRRRDSKKESDKKALKSAQDEWRRSQSGLQRGVERQDSGASRGSTPGSILEEEEAKETQIPLVAVTLSDDSSLDRRKKGKKKKGFSLRSLSPFRSRKGKNRSKKKGRLDPFDEEGSNSL